MTRDQLYVLGEEIAAIASQIDAATHTLLTRIRTFDAEQGWARQGALSCAHWLGWRIGLLPGAAREKVRVARALGTLPLLDEALRTNLLSYSKLRALTRIATPENESRLLEIAKSCTAGQLETLCREHGRVLRDDAGRPVDSERWVRQRTTESGMVRIEAQLTADEAALVMKALDAARAALAGGERTLLSPGAALVPAHVSAETSRESGTGDVSAETSDDSDGWFPEGEPEPPEEVVFDENDEIVEVRPRRTEPVDDVVEPDFALATQAVAWPSRAEALLAVAESFLSGTVQSRAGGERYTVLVHLAHDTAGGLSGDGIALEDGTRVCAETLRRIACDAGLVAIAEGPNGQTLDVGRRRRTIPPAIRRALASRDRGCRFPGCTNRLFVDAHHIDHWLHGGRTALDNLVLLCGQHHRLVHEEAFAIVKQPDGTVGFSDPRGRAVDVAPARPHAAPLAPLPPMPVPNWWGERVDHPLVVGVMLGGAV
jgi:hypothetical protein